MDTHEHVCSTCGTHVVCKDSCLVDDNNCPVDDDSRYECEKCLKETMEVWWDLESF